MKPRSAGHLHVRPQRSAHHRSFDKRMPKVSKRPAVRMPAAAEDKAITAAARSDPAVQPFTPGQPMVPLKSLRGRPKSENKKLLISVRYSPEVVSYFKSTGEGWQSRMDGVLRQYVSRHSRST